MKKVLSSAFLLLTILIFVNCSSSEDEIATPSVSMQLDGGVVNRPAGSEITGLGISTNYTGTLNWTIERTYSGSTTIFATSTGANLSFVASKVGEYRITLATANNTAYAVKMITVYRPISFKVDKVKLTSIPQGYTGLYFKIKKYTALTSTVSYIYTSTTKNVTTNALSLAYWNISLPSFIIIDSIVDADQYTIEFYAQNTSGVNAMVTSMDIIHNFYATSEALNTYSPIESLNSSNTNCGACHNFVIEHEREFL